MFLRPAVQVSLVISSVKVSINPLILDDLHTFAEYLENFMIIPDLKAYRPRKRPLVIDPVRHVPEKVK